MSNDGASPFTTHKVRADWFQQRTSYPKREAVPAALSRPRPTAGPVWKEVGPPDIGGRLTSMAVDPAKPDRVFVGSAGGGVWYTEDAGRNWRQVWSDHAPTLAIGSLTMDPHDSNILYAGTGEANLSGETYPGAGVFKTTDGAKTWSLVGDVANHLAPLPGQPNGPLYLLLGISRRVGTIARDPSDPQHILIGGVTHSDEGAAALFETRDGGQTWKQAQDANHSSFADSMTQGSVFISLLDYYCHSVVFHPDQPGLVLATVEARGTQSGIWVSKDGAKSWLQAKTGLPSGDQFGRTTLTVAAGSKTIYALAGQQGTQRLLGVFRSDDLGATWTECARGGFANDGQLSYTNCIAMDPRHPMTAVVGSLELYKTTDGGATWNRISDGTNLFGDNYVHRDHHALWIGNGGIYSANDGGFAVSEDGGDSWEMRNKGLAIAMLYDVAVASSDSRCMGCGMQDNGTWFAGALNPPTGGFTPKTAFRQELEGDGGWTCYDPDDATHVYASQQRMDLWRHRASDSWANLDLTMIPDEERKSVWMAVLAMDRSQSVKPRTTPRAVYIGSSRVWRSLDDADTWQAISDPFDGSIISALEVAPADPRYLYVGTTDGGLFRSQDGGATWSRNLAGAYSPGRIVTRIATAPSNALKVYFTVGVVALEFFYDDPNAQAPEQILRMGLPLTRADGKQGWVDFHHVFESADGGNTWNDADMQGQLPNLPHNSVALSAAGVLFVAHDGGVAMAQPPGSAWTDITGNLPNIRITDLVYHERDRLLVVSTYGRGIWTLSADALGSWSK